MKKHLFKAGQYWAAAYNGNNGDLIVGRVKSVRSTGEVVLDNLLSERVATKSAKVMKIRNKRISKAQADELVALYRETGDRQVVRACAVTLKAFDDSGQQELPFTHTCKRKRGQPPVINTAKKNIPPSILTIYWPPDGISAVAQIGMLSLTSEVVGSLIQMHALTRVVNMCWGGSCVPGGIHFMCKSDLRIFDLDCEETKKQEAKLRGIAGDQPDDNYYEPLDDKDAKELRKFKCSDLFLDLEGETSLEGVTWIDTTGGHTATMSWKLLLGFAIMLEH